MRTSGSAMESCRCRVMQSLLIYHVRISWLRTAAVVLNIMVICVFWWCIVVGIVLSLVLNYIIGAPQQRYANLSILVFMTGALGLIVSLSAFNCFKRRGRCGLMTYVIVLWIMTISVLVNAILLLLASKNQNELYEWIDKNLEEVFQNGAQSVRGMEAVFLIESQLSCCGFNGTSHYPPDSMTVGCCDGLKIKCTIDTAHKKDCRVAFMEMVQGRFEDFGISLLCAALIIFVAIMNSCLMLAKMRSDEKEMEINR
ncbi:hypothetical protein ECG_00123 [Echinococcus granulosus]|nr:hypothetical protein ECG_00123 [Echinococcus granulosus]